MKATLGVKEASYFQQMTPKRIVSVKQYEEPYETLCEVQFENFVDATMLFSMGVEYGRKKELEFQNELKLIQHEK